MLPRSNMPRVRSGDPVSPREARGQTRPIRTARSGPPFPYRHERPGQARPIAQARSSIATEAAIVRGRARSLLTRAYRACIIDDIPGSGSPRDLDSVRKVIVAVYNVIERVTSRGDSGYDPIGFRSRGWIPFRIRVLKQRGRLYNCDTAGFRTGSNPREENSHRGTERSSHGPLDVQGALKPAAGWDAG